MRTRVIVQWIQKCAVAMSLMLPLPAYSTGACLAADHAGGFERLFTPVGDFPLGARTSRTDYESIDAVGRRLYLAKMGAGQLVVFDIDRNRLVAELDGFPKITGVLVVPELHKVYASVPGAGLVASVFVGLGMMGLSSGRGALAVRDTRDLREVARVPAGVFPDGIAYDAADRRIFVSDELGSAITVMDAKADKPIARIAAGGEVGNVRYDAVTERVYAPVQSRNEWIAVDPAHATIVSRHPTRGGEHPHGFIIAPASAMGYAACDGNDVLLAVDLVSGRVLSKQPVAHDADVLAIDAKLNRLYVASESGELSTFDIAHAEAPRSLGDVFVAAGAHAVAVDPNSHRLYFGLANHNGRSVLRVLEPKPS